MALNDTNPLLFLINILFIMHSLLVYALLSYDVLYINPVGKQVLRQTSSMPCLTKLIYADWIRPITAVYVGTKQFKSSQHGKKYPYIS